MHPFRNLQEPGVRPLLDRPAAGVVARRAAMLSVAFGLAGLSAPHPALAQKAGTGYVPQVGQAGKDVVWVPTPDEVAEKMLDMAQVGPRDKVVDLGSGDGKIAIAAARRGARARGIEYNPDMVALSRRNAANAGVKVEFVQGDIFKSDFRDADVVTLYLLPTLNERLKPILLKMKPGTRVASHAFQMGDWEPDETASVGSRMAFFWRVPAQVGGRWSVRIGADAGPALTLRQTYQKLEGEAQTASGSVPLQAPRIEGANVSFVVPNGAGGGGGGDLRFEATADHQGRMKGTVTDASGASRPFTATRQARAKGTTSASAHAAPPATRSATASSSRLAAAGTEGR